MNGACRNLPHCLIQCAENTFQRFFNRQKITRIILVGVPGQISLCNGSKHIRYLAYVRAEITDGIFKYFSKKANFIIGTHAYLNFSAVGQPQFTFFHLHGCLCDFTERSRHFQFQIECKKNNADNNHCHTDYDGIADDSGRLLLRFLYGYSGKNQAVSLTVGSLGGNIGAKIFYSQNIRFPNISPALFQYDIAQVGSQLGSDHAFSVLRHRTVSSGVALENSKLATHTLLKSIQHLVNIFAVRYSVKLPCKHVRTVRTNLLLHASDQRIVHEHADCHRKDNGYRLHNYYNISDLFPDTPDLFSALFHLPFFHTVISPF